MSIMPASVFLLCLATSAACSWLLFRQYRHTRAKLLFWSALCFLALTANNLFVVFDLIVFPTVNFVPFRHLSSLIAVGVLLYAFIWEAD